jgi:hypothetical protein
MDLQTEMSHCLQIYLHKARKTLKRQRPSQFLKHSQNILPGAILRWTSKVTSSVNITWFIPLPMIYTFTITIWSSRDRQNFSWSPTVFLVIVQPTRDPTSLWPQQVIVCTRVLWFKWSTASVQTSTPQSPRRSHHIRYSWFNWYKLYLWWLRPDGCGVDVQMPAVDHLEHRTQVHMRTCCSQRLVGSVRERNCDTSGKYLWNLLYIV